MLDALVVFSLPLESETNMNVRRNNARPHEYVRPCLVIDTGGQAALLIEVTRLCTELFSLPRRHELFSSAPLLLPGAEAKYQKRSRLSVSLMRFLWSAEHAQVPPPTTAM